jgi:hypothetical protein
VAAPFFLFVVLDGIPVAQPLVIGKAGRALTGRRRAPLRRFRPVVQRPCGSPGPLAGSLPHPSTQGRTAMRPYADEIPDVHSGRLHSVLLSPAHPDRKPTAPVEASRLRRNGEASAFTANPTGFSMTR